MGSTIKKPTSRRFSELRFHGLSPLARDKVEYSARLIVGFAKTLINYLKRKIRRFVKLIAILIKGAFALFTKAKSWLIRKLIWSRGRLGRQIANSLVLSAAVLVFLLGEVFSGSRYVSSQEVSPDILKNHIDIIPEKNTALTEIPESRQRTEYISYEIQSGDNLFNLGKKFTISVDALRYVNNLYDDSRLSVGQKILIPPSSGIIHKVKPGETLESIASKYSVPSQSIADFNYILDTSKMSVGQELVVPDARIPDPTPEFLALVPGVLTNATSNDPNASKDWCIWPTTARYVSQAYSWKHNGLDIASSWGSSYPPLYACAPGTVVRAGWDPWGLGLHVRIDHGGGYETVYGHMSRLDVSYGDKVDRGEVIGLLGNTGRSTGPHVHFMVKYNGAPQNPLNYIQ